MKASKMPIHRTGSSLLPLSVYAVVFVDFWPDVTDKGQKVIQDLIPVLPEVGLEDGHLLLGVLLHFSAAAAVGSQSRSLLGLELLLPLQAVLFDFSLGFFFGLLQPSVLSLAGLGHLLRGSLLGLEQLLDALRLTSHGGSNSEVSRSGLNRLTGPLRSTDPPPQV